ncbi:hypothetical protein [Aureispira anguillae]|uniref:Uncharacterized protein n=1 Tax=Aureispira anguillae TaxID=2864201 RepID=A0A916DWP6_9BACT|nr:hypothetical protein [Aureispira anguillae]BDS15681.1 hypothetical protein AsAng_0064650 [Aureispira anguillae]
MRRIISLRMFLLITSSIILFCSFKTTFDNSPYFIKWANSNLYLDGVIQMRETTLSKYNPSFTGERWLLQEKSQGKYQFTTMAEFRDEKYADLVILDGELLLLLKGDQRIHKASSLWEMTQSNGHTMMVIPSQRGEFAHENGISVYFTMLYGFNF